MAHQNLADLFDSLGRYQEALEIYKLLQQAPPHGFFYLSVISAVQSRLSSNSDGEKDRYPDRDATDS